MTSPVSTATGPPSRSGSATVCLVGMPNSGKSTLMNALTGGHFHTANYPGVSACETAISPKLAMIIERAMSLEPEDRYPTLRELGRDLLRLAGQRTRVTWGLTFGDIAQGQPGRATSANAIDLHPGNHPPTERPSGGRKRALAAVFAAAGLCSAVLLGLDPLTGSTTDQTPAESVVLNAKAIEAPARPSPPSEPVATATAEATDPTPDAAPEPEEEKSEPKAAKNQSASSNASSTRRQRVRRSKARRKRRASRQPRRTAATQKKPESSGLERPAWALGPTGETESQSSAKAGPVLGTNNAPILD